MSVTVPVAYPRNSASTLKLPVLPVKVRKSRPEIRADDMDGGPALVGVGNVEIESDGLIPIGKGTVGIAVHEPGLRSVGVRFGVVRVEFDGQTVAGNCLFEIPLVVEELGLGEHVDRLLFRSRAAGEQGQGDGEGVADQGRSLASGGGSRQSVAGRWQPRRRMVAWDRSAGLAFPGFQEVLVLLTKPVDFHFHRDPIFLL